MTENIYVKLHENQTCICWEIRISVTNDVVTVDNINLFKKRLDKFWLLKDYVYSYRAQPMEAGSVK